ncbi:endodeoxyribonuclease [Vanrija albida]|uniref:DNA topoisomerase (ATP-hydrolyzing) n=1 Tax=Vanrija albida TaxID=181172 RepID=A0ABR3PTJ7_9TREE
MPRPADTSGTYRSEPGEQSADESSDETLDLSDTETKAVAFLESLCQGFLQQTFDAVSADPWRSLALPQRGPGARNGTLGIELQLTNRSTGQPQIISFPDEPGTQPSQPALIRIARILCVAAVLYEAVITNGIVTMRDVYYRNVPLFGQQRVVDNIVDDLVATAGLKREDFHVCASAKGLVASDCLFITLTTGEALPLSSTNAALIPPRQRIADISAPNGVDWILVVEKDAIMQSLCGLRLLEDERLGSGVLITGKGYPDLATLQFLRLLADTFPRTPIYALVDADPHGIDILSVYTYGSRNNAHSAHHAGLGLGDRLRWMGLKATDLWRFGAYDELIELGEKDVQLAQSMIARANLPPEWRRELVHMLHLRRKAEIQIMSGPAVGRDEIAQSLAGLSSQQARRSRLIEYVVGHLREGARQLRK